MGVGRLNAAIVLMLLGTPPSLEAQTRLDTVISRLRPGQTIRVTSRDFLGGRAEGRLAGIQDGVLRLQPADSPDIPLAGIDSVWVRGRATVKGAIVGAVVLGVTGYLVVNCSGQNDCPGYQGPAGAAAGLAGGALVGALIGAAIPRWRPRYGAAAPAAGFQWNPNRPYDLAFKYRF